jgi:hypothetical protein
LRAQAKQSIAARRKNGLLRRFAPRNDVGRKSAISRRDAPELCVFLRLEKQRAQGKPGARCTRSRAWCVVSTRVSHHRFTGTPGLPCAMVLTAYFALSPVTGYPMHTSLLLRLSETDSLTGRRCFGGLLDVDGSWAGTIW